MARHARSRSRSHDPSRWAIGTRFRITGPRNDQWYPGKRIGWQPQFYLGWPDDWPRSEKVTRNMSIVNLRSTFIVQEIRHCGEFITVAVQDWTYRGVPLKINVQKGQEAWAERCEYHPPPEIHPEA